VRILDVSAHFNLHFMNQVFAASPEILISTSRAVLSNAPKNSTGPPTRTNAGLVLSFKTGASQVALRSRTHHHVGGIRRRHWLAAVLDQSKQSPGDLYGNCHGPGARVTAFQISGARSSPNLTAGMSVKQHHSPIPKN